MVLGGIYKIVIYFAVVFIAATMLGGLLPGLSNKIYAAGGDKFGFGPTTIVDFSARQTGSNTFNVGYTILGSYNKITKIDVSYKYSEDGNFKDSEKFPSTEGLSLENNVARVLSAADPSGKINGEITLDESRGWYKFTIEVYLTDGDVPSDNVIKRIGVPSELGSPDFQGVYIYDEDPRDGIAPMYYRYNGVAWEWTPYYPVWMPVTTTIINNIYDPDDEYVRGDWHGEEPEGGNKAIINLLAENNPVPPKTPLDLYRVPTKLGGPNPEGVYTYDDNAFDVVDPVYYNFDNNAWRWTPYNPVWMLVTTTIVNNIYDPDDDYVKGDWHGKQPEGQRNIEIINYLATDNPTP